MKFSLKEYSLQIAVLALIIAIIVGKHYYIYYSLIILGEYPILGVTWVIVFLLSFLLFPFALYPLVFLQYILKLIFPKFQLTDSDSCPVGIFIACFIFSCLLGPVFLYGGMYYKTVDNIKSELMEKSHIEKGWIYKIRGPEYRGNTASRIFAGVDKDHITIHGIDYDIRKKCNMKEGDEVTLRVSDDYPRVNEIIECNGIKLESLINKDDN